jgi:hypothetical protein
MAIRRQLLRNLKQHCTAKNDHAHKNNVLRIDADAGYSHVASPLV